MYIKNIQLENFQCYYKDGNSFEFQNGLNLILGSINKGKSKLFDAFYWALFGEIYITRDDWYNTNRLGVIFINDRIKKESISGDVINCSVTLTFNHGIEDEDIDYTIKRIVRAERKGDSEWHNDSGWLTANSVVEMSYKTPERNHEILDTEGEVEHKLRQLFPFEIRDYIWFQGEALDKLIDFSNKATFEQAIKYISYYPRYEMLAEIIDLARDKIDKVKNKKIKSKTGQKKEYERLDKLITDKKEEIRLRKKELGDKENELVQVGEKLLETKTKLEALHDFPPLEKTRLEHEKKISEVKNKIEQIDNLQKQQFQQLWLLKGTEKLLVNSKKILIDYDKVRTKDKKYTLPDDVPPKVYLEAMLDAKWCLICDRSAEEDSDPYNYIQSRITSQEEYYKNIEENKNLQSTIQLLQTYPDEVLYKLKGINKQIERTQDEIDEAINLRHEISHDLREAVSAIDKLMSKYGISLATGTKQSRELTSKLSFFLDRKEQLNEIIAKKKQTINQLESELKEAQKNLIDTAPADSDKIKEIRWAQITQLLKEIISYVKENAKLDLIESIEKTANKHYFNITKHNKAVDGKIFIDKESYKISRTEDDLYQIASGNVGNDTLMKMCIINAMLSLNQEVTGIPYPFITDAPTSDLDDETTIAYLKSLATTFSQSIIITKDVSKFRLSEIVKEKEVKVIYELNTYTDRKGDERLKQYEAYSVVKKIK